MMDPDTMEILYVGKGVKGRPSQKHTVAAYNDAIVSGSGRIQWLLDPIHAEESAFALEKLLISEHNPKYNVQAGHGRAQMSEIAPTLFDRVLAAMDRRSGQVQTPIETARAMVAAIPERTIVHGSIALPCVGTGNFAQALQERAEDLNAVLDDRVWLNDTDVKLLGMTLMQLNFRPMGVSCGNFLQELDNMKFDAIIMNPPYNQKQAVGHSGKKTWNVFFDKAVSALAEDGVAVMMGPIWGHPINDVTAIDVHDRQPPEVLFEGVMSSATWGVFRKTTGQVGTLPMREAPVFNLLFTTEASEGVKQHIGQERWVIDTASHKLVRKKLTESKSRGTVAGNFYIPHGAADEIEKFVEWYRSEGEAYMDTIHTPNIGFWRIGMLKGMFNEL